MREKFKLEKMLNLLGSDIDNSVPGDNTREVIDLLKQMLAGTCVCKEKEAHKSWCPSRNCYYCDEPAVGKPTNYVDYSPFTPPCCKHHRLSVTRASKIQGLVYEGIYKHFMTASAANQWAEEQLSVDWDPFE